MSIPLGVVTLAEHFGGTRRHAAILCAMVEEVAQYVAPFAAEHGGDLRDMHLLGTSGTVTTLAGVHLNLARYDRRRIDGIWMSDADITATIARLLGMSYQERVANNCISVERADLVLAGCAILDAIRHAFPLPRLRVADRGLREGMLVEMMREDGVLKACVSSTAQIRSEHDEALTMAKDTTGRLHVTVKTGGKRKLSSKLWLERQLNDPYVAQAKREGYRSRAAYKLIEIDDKYHLLKPGMTVVDLGAAPGGWSQIAAKRVGVADGKGKVVAIDLLEMPEIAGVDFRAARFPRRRRAGQAARDDGRRRRCRDVRHGRQHHRPSQDRPAAHHRPGRGGGGVCLRGAESRRHVPGKGVSERRRSGAAGAAQARFCQCHATSSRPSSRQDSSERYVLATGFRRSAEPLISRARFISRAADPRASACSRRRVCFAAASAALARSALAAGDLDRACGRRSRWPASSGICQKNQADAAEMIDTTMKAGANIVGDQLGGVTHQHRRSPPQNAPTATPAEIASCWLTLTSVVARLICAGSTSA